MGEFSPQHPPTPPTPTPSPTHYKSKLSHPLSMQQPKKQPLPKNLPLQVCTNPPPTSPSSSFQFHKMLGKKRLGSMEQLAKKVKDKDNFSNADPKPSHYECLLRDEGGASPTPITTPTTTPTGTFVIYVGEDRQRFVVPIGYLSHPLFKILLEKAYNEFGFEQRNGLVVPCSVTAFQEVITAVECCSGKFDFGNWVEEFL